MSDHERFTPDLEPFSQTPEQRSLVGRLILACLRNRLLVVLGVALLVLAALVFAPFDWRLGWLPREPVPVDAIPDIGENQQIVFTAWPGQSPTDIDDQISYPLTTQLLGMKGIKTVRATSMFGFSSLYVIFDERTDFYDARTRLLEKLSSLPPELLPEGVQPKLGPEATALGQVFWYTLEGRDRQGNPAGGWDLEELRTLQDWYVRYGLAAAEGVAEVASVGGYVREYQVDIDPDALRATGVTLEDVYRAVRQANLNVGARTLELNRVEYFVRGVGLVDSVEDLGDAVIAVRDDVPILVRQVATVTLGPAPRRGALDKEGAQAVGGVVVARYGANPLAVIQAVKQRIAEIEPGLPSKTLEDGRVSKVTVVPFYDRTELIHETLGTLEHALRDEILVTIVVVLVMVLHLRSSVLIAAMLPLAVGACFIAMKLFGVDANIVALSGIAIAIGTIVDMGIVICESVLRHLDEADPGQSRLAVVHRGASEVGSAVLTAVATTVVGFLPVFVMTGSEGKLFRPLAFTKTFALIASILIALLVLPTGAHLLLRRRTGRPKWQRYARPMVYVILLLSAGLVLSATWRPLSYRTGLLRNLAFVAILVGGLLLAFHLFQWAYPRILRWCLRHKAALLGLGVVTVLLGLSIWLGFASLFAPAERGLNALGVPSERIRESRAWSAMAKAFPGLGGEFMPPLDEGSFLYMPTTMVHASIGEALDVVSRQDRAFRAIPEVDMVVGKIGRADSPLDPAPVSMIETVITYKPEWAKNDQGQWVRQWRDEIRSPDDIWQEIVRVGKLPGVTSAPKLQPIATRLVMLQTGMRAPMGVKILGGDLETIEAVGLRVEEILRGVPGIEPATVNADRIVGKPYIVIDTLADDARRRMARNGISAADVLRTVEMAVGGMGVTTTIEGRERFAVRIRYQREMREDLDRLGSVLVAGKQGRQVPLNELVAIRYERGPQGIKSEDTFKVGYVTFDKAGDEAEVTVVRRAQAAINLAVEDGSLVLPKGVTLRFSGTYENQVRAQKTLSIVLPMALVVIIVILYLHFRSLATTLMVFSGVAVAFAGGFLLIWFYGRPWFADVNLLGANLREVFGMQGINLSVAVWVGFLALFGIATDDGVVMASYLDQSFRRREPGSRDEIREAVVAAGARRIRPCLMTTATTILALLPVLTSTGRGSDIMIPMAIPSVGGMTIEVLTMLIVPTLYCAARERRLAKKA